MNSPHDRSAWMLGGDATCRTPPARPAQSRRIVLLGPPGVGKGTQAELLDAAFGACYLSTGDLFRQAAGDCPSCTTAAEAALQTARNYSRRGDTVPDDALLELINARLRCLTCTGGFILDGFPRNEEQAKVLDLLLESRDLALDAVILYELPTSQLIPRLLGRRVCPTCHRFYHVKNRPPHQTDICDDCLTPLVQLTNDRLDTIRLMSGHHLRNSQPLVNYYRQRDLLVSIPADGTPEDVFARTIDAFSMSRRA